MNFCVLLVYFCSQRVEEVEDGDGDLLVNRSDGVDLVSETLSEPLKNMVRSEGYAQRSSED